MDKILPHNQNAITFLNVQVWSSELADVAQAYAEGCVFDHNANRVSQQTVFTSVGENLAAGSGAANYTNFIKSWNNEVDAYDYDANSCSDVCGHYTQVTIFTCMYKCYV